MKKIVRIFSYIKDYKQNIFLYALFILLSIVFGLASIGMLSPFLDLIFQNQNLVNGNAVNNIAANSGIKETFYAYLKNIISVHGKVYALGIICIFIIITIFLKNLFLYLSSYFLTPVRNSVSKKYTTAIYQKLLELPIGYFTEQRKGDIMSRSSSDVIELENSVTAAMDGVIKEPLNIIGVLIFLFYISPQLTLFVFLFLPVTGFVVGRIGRTLKKQTNRAQVKWGEILSHLEETLTGLRIIKAFNAEQKMYAGYDKLTSEQFHIKNKIYYRRDLASPLSEFLGVCILCGVLWFGGRLVLSGSILSPGEFITYIAIFSQIINPAKALSTAFYNVQRGSATLDRINEILNAPVVVQEKQNAVGLKNFNGSVEFRNVNFSYTDIPVLKNINLCIEKGKTIALVGSSGSGKSTMADLVPRFHDVTSGELLIDDINIKDYSLQSLREQISIVTQEPILFNDTIANNIALSKPDASRKEIEDAAKVANAYNFILKKEAGFDTMIGDRGGKLSGGERQRLTIARAVLKNPPILILDEATSSLDTESERLVQDAINKMMQNRTSIVIAHRLSTIRHADEIIVLQKGEIAERGTHAELMKHSGIYNRLVEMQELR
ncbi:MAG: ABC transporter ATP-binding protein [Parafilimonas sp.]